MPIITFIYLGISLFLFGVAIYCSIVLDRGNLQGLLAKWVSRILICSALMGGFCFLLVVDANDQVDMHREEYVAYRELPSEVYDLHEITRGVYYKYEAGGLVSDPKNFVLVYIVDENGFIEERSYDEKIVSFDEGDKACITVIKEESYWCKSMRGFGFVGEPSEGERVSSVVISTPKERGRK